MGKINKTLSRLLIIVLVFLVSSVDRVEINAGEFNDSPYLTFTPGAGTNGRLVPSTNAFEGFKSESYGLNLPSDMYIDEEDNLFIADTGNNRILKVASDGTQQEIGVGILSGPSGVYGKDNILYVADTENLAIRKFDEFGNLIETFTRPSSNLYGSTQTWKPTKISVDMNDNIYVVSEGNANGVVMLDKKGDFISYYAPNELNLSVSYRIRRALMTPEERDKLAPLTPPAISNIAIDSDNLLYTLTHGYKTGNIRKVNVKGNSVIDFNAYSYNYTDIVIDNEGYIYTVNDDTDLNVEIYDQEGSLLFAFGMYDSAATEFGQFNSPSAIEIDSNGNLYVLDRIAGNLQVFYPTNFMSLLKDAEYYYKVGDYEASKEKYKEILEINSLFLKSYVSLGNIAMLEEEYEDALLYFELANVKSGYSEAYWQIRDESISAYFTIFMVGIVAIVVLRKSYRYAVENKGLSIEPINKFNDKKSELVGRYNDTQVSGEVRQLKSVFTKPYDTFYDVKYNASLRGKTALWILVAFAVITIFSGYFIRGFLFSDISYNNYSFVLEIIKFLLIPLILIVSNYLISSLQNGEGYFSDTFKVIVLSLSPFILFTIPLDILTNFLTLNEEFVFTFARRIMLVSSVVLMIYSIKLVHNYTIRGLIANIILTFITAIILVLAFMLVYILSMEFLGFIIDIIREMFI